MDIHKIVAKLIQEDTEEMERIRRNAAKQLGVNRAARYLHLLSRVDALTDVTGLIVRRLVEEERTGAVRLVVVAGPNQPEVLTLEEVADVLTEFDTSECLFWVRQESGNGLQIVYADSVDTTYDDAFVYWVTTFRTAGPLGRELGTCSWSKNRVRT